MYIVYIRGDTVTDILHGEKYFLNLAYVNNI